MNEAWKLITECDTIHTIIEDEELDPFRCVFRNNCIEIDTTEYGYITLSVEILKKIISLIKKAEKEYKTFS